MNNEYDYHKAKALIEEIERVPEGILWLFLQRVIFEGKSWDGPEVYKFETEFKSLSFGERAAVLRGLQYHAQYIVRHAANLTRSLAMSRGER